MSVRVIRAVCAAAALFAVLCTKNHPVLNDTAVAEAALLKESIAKAAELGEAAKSKGRRSTETAMADSLTDLAEAKQKEGKGAEAYWMAELASTYYRLALAKRELRTSEERVKKLEQSLTQAKGQLETYQEVLNELESAGKK